MARYLLRATSRTGAKVNIATGGPTEEIAVYSDADLTRRLTAAQTDPRDLDITVRRLDDQEDTP